MSKKLLTLTAIGALIAGILIANWLRSDFKTLAGESHRWQDFQGDWVVVNYFAEWCAPCLKEVPELNQFNQQIAGRNMHLFAVSWDALSNTELTVIQQRYAMQFSLLSSQPPPQMPFAKPAQLPATFILSPKGELVKTLLGEQTSESLLQQLQTLALTE
ncbi:TlpA disulfide reductase family protein [Alteromonadaceae bacterium BrNp21-10]|nr:TlpA disulfide reductase family protein [Alteromonadaceae bacterium BrNp21-10]